MADLFGRCSVFGRGTYVDGVWKPFDAPTPWGSDGFGGYGSWERLAKTFADKGLRTITNGFEFPAFNVEHCKIFCRITLSADAMFKAREAK